MSGSGRPIPSRAVLGIPRPLRWREAAAPVDLPPHVRAGSAVRRWGGHRVVVQDDVNALALLDERDGSVVPLVLPAGEGGRRVFGDRTGNKAHKLDLEACVTLPDGRLVAFGSGSTPARDRLVVVSVDREVRVVDGRALYEGLRRRTDFSGAELNVEGAVVLGGRLVLMQRGNGAARPPLQAVDALATLDLEGFVAWLEGRSPPPPPEVRPVSLGAIAGVRLGFTDGAAVPDGRLAFLAAAEASPDTFRDGVVVGCRFGLMDPAGPRLVEVVEPDGAPTLRKLEGLDWVAEEPDGAWRFVVVTDADDPDRPAEIADLRVTFT